MVKIQQSRSASRCATVITSPSATLGRREEAIMRTLPRESGFATQPGRVPLAGRAGRGIEAAVLSKAARIDLADSALHAPSASFGGEEFIDKAAVLTCRLVWNHPLPDGNKRAAWAALVLFLDLNRIVWSPDPPDVDDAEQAMLALAAHEVDESRFADWLRQRVQMA